MHRCRKRGIAGTADQRALDSQPAAEIRERPRARAGERGVIQVILLQFGGGGPAQRHAAQRRSRIQRQF